MTIFNMHSSILNSVSYCLLESPFNSGYRIISEPKLKRKKYGFELGCTLLLNYKLSTPIFSLCKTCLISMRL